MSSGLGIDNGQPRLNGAGWEGSKAERERERETPTTAIGQPGS